MKIAVYDEVQKDRELVSRMITEYSDTKGIPVNIRQFGNADELLEVFRKDSFAAVFVGLNSMREVDVAWIIRGRDKECPIVIMSRCSDYSLEGYRLKALDYMLKPPDEQRVHTTLDRLMP
jgi:DNA-binding LytR/AlgR family response regulator